MVKVSEGLKSALYCIGGSVSMFCAIYSGSKLAEHVTGSMNEGEVYVKKEKSG